MTVLIGLEHQTELSKLVPVNYNAYKRAVSQNASVAGFVTNENTTFRDLLYGTMLPSGGECADTIANYISGDQNDFVELMNKRAAKIGLQNTQYKTADGLDEIGQYSSAKDIALLLAEALKNEDFRAIFTRQEYRSTPTIDHPKGLYMKSTVFNKLEEYSYSGFEIIGGKSGTTEKAGLCWATLVVKNKKEYIIVTMDADEGNPDSKKDGQVLDTLEILTSL